MCQLFFFASAMAGSTAALACSLLTGRPYSAGGDGGRAAGCWACASALSRPTVGTQTPSQRPAKVIKAAVRISISPTARAGNVAAPSSGRKLAVDDDLHRPAPIRIGELSQDQQGGLAGEPTHGDNRSFHGDQITGNSGQSDATQRSRPGGLDG